MFFLPVSYSRAYEITNKDGVSPIRISPKKALLGLTFFDFIDCPVGPYREIALTIPVSLNYRYKPDIVPLLFQKSLSKYFALYTIMLGMNTLHGQKHANKIFGYPVYNNLLNIDFVYNNRDINVSVRDNGNDILIFKNNINKKFKKYKRSYQTIFHADDGVKLVNLSATTVESSTYMDKLTNFQLGEHSIANKIKDLEPSMFSLQTSFYQNAVETLSNPENIKI